MSTTFSLCCFEDEVCMWVGQSNYLYSDNGTLAALQRFLNGSEGKPILLLSDHDDRVLDCQVFEETLSYGAFD